MSPLGVVDNAGVIFQGNGQAFAGQRPALAEYANPRVAGKIASAEHEGARRGQRKIGLGGEQLSAQQRVHRAADGGFAGAAVVGQAIGDIDILQGQRGGRSDIAAQQGRLVRLEGNVVALFRLRLARQVRQHDRLPLATARAAAGVDVDLRTHNGHAAGVEFDETAAGLEGDLRAGLDHDLGTCLVVHLAAGFQELRIAVELVASLIHLKVVIAFYLGKAVVMHRQVIVVVNLGQPIAVQLQMAVATDLFGTII
ncbi:hypothetical protein CZ787_06430 [Halomonas citrativorans]|uniref:Uncharacterized protein n=1 Tax=Halomonas citrativorans TaxID=2742612 RepID=A0A1R4HVW7_9GAMM|nr:hypothetical protein CZ787_06430 [Halomonas citrativorans]